MIDKFYEVYLQSIIHLCIKKANALAIWHAGVTGKDLSKLSRELF